MIEREGDRNALNVVRPDGGHFPGGVCDENVSLEQDGQENVEMTMELCGEEFGERKPKKVQDPKLPSPEEVLEHNFSHLPYRSWCRHCVRGRCKEIPHRRVSEEPKMSEVHFDFGFLGKEHEPGKLVPVLVIRERVTGMTMASTMTSKSSGTFITNRVIAFLREIGCEFGDLLAKSDQEPAVMAIVNEVGRVRSLQGGGRFVVENSPVGSHASHGLSNVPFSQLRLRPESC